MVRFLCDHLAQFQPHSGHPVFSATQIDCCACVNPCARTACVTVLFALLLDLPFAVTLMTGATTTTLLLLSDPTLMGA